jgi:FkbM family methyltransferase
MSVIKRAFHALPAPVRRQTKATLLGIGAAMNLIPDGTHIFFDIKRRLRNENFGLFFDVGANVGQSVRQFLTEFPGAKILAFEPDPDTFKKLEATVQKMPGVEALNFGFSRQSGVVRFDNTSPVIEMHRLADNQQDTSLPLVRFSTIDEFCAEKGIGNIDYLKIDTEGHDLDVLNGAAENLKRGAIGLAVAECSMNSDNPGISAFFDVHQYMDQFGYRLFGVYEQTPGTFTSRPQLRRANCVYISPAVIARNPYSG